MKKIGLDLLKAGIFLIGVSMLIISIVIVHFYLRSLKYDNYYHEKFYAYCSSEDGVIVISANEKLKNVTVENSTHSIICNIPQINMNSDEGCFIGKNKTGIFIVRSDDTQKVVRCYRLPTEPIPYKD